MCSSKEDLHRQANWPGVEGGARERLMDRLQGEPLFVVLLRDNKKHKFVPSLYISLTRFKILK